MMTTKLNKTEFIDKEEKGLLVKTSTQFASGLEAELEVELATELAKYEVKVKVIREQFAILKTKINDHPLVYLDNAATTQKPQAVIESISNFYQTSNASSHSVHSLAGKVGSMVEEVRGKVLDFVGADISKYDCVFVRGATEAVNLVASSINFVGAGDVVLATTMEHHSNYLPWIAMCNQVGARLELVKIIKNRNDSYDIDYLDLEEKMVKFKPKLLAITGASNVLGNVTDLSKVLEIAKKVNCKVQTKVLVDGTQLVAHGGLEIDKLDLDFVVFSGHKMYGPTGVGCLVAGKELLEKMQNYQTGGEMVEEVGLIKIDFKTGPARFEAGTLDFAGIIGLGASFDFLKDLNQEFGGWQKYEVLLNRYLQLKLRQIKGVKIINVDSKLPITTFVIDGFSPLDVASYLDIFGIAVRSGKHCTGILHQVLGLESGSIRASLSFYNTKAEVDFLIEKVGDFVDKFGKKAG